LCCSNFSQLLTSRTTQTQGQFCQLKKLSGLNGINILFSFYKISFHK